MTHDAKKTLSIITPAYNEERNLPLLHEQIMACLDSSRVHWEWIVVDDHSRDRTFAIVSELASKDNRVSGVRLSRNSGSHTAILSGLERASGDCVVVMAADLQDPPDVVNQMISYWEQGNQVVWAVRERREGIGVFSRLTSRMYYWLMRNIVGIKTMAPTGADFFLLDRVVVEALKQIRESNLSVFAMISWVGFRHANLSYAKQARQHGVSGWSFRKKMKLVVDSFISFSHKPILWMSAFGFVVALLGFAYAFLVVINRMYGVAVEGWSSLMVVVLILCGSQMFMLGIIGEYLWRTLEEARRRPRYFVEDEVNRPDASTYRQIYASVAHD